MKKFEDKIYKYRKILDDSMTEVYSDGPVLLSKPIKYVLSGKGKRFRPILSMIICDSNNISLDDFLYPSIAIEMLHNFTLIHDDIMDNDHLRHGKMTVHEKWNSNTAILSGDAMLAISMRMLLKNNLNHNDKLLKTYINGLLSVCEGQALDIEFESRSNVSLEEYKRMIYLKTAYMIGLSSEIGGIISRLDKSEISILKQFGDCIGMAYQVQDDTLELFSDSDSMNKSLDSDFRLQKKTFHWSSIEAEHRNELEKIISGFSSNKEKTINDLRQFMINHGVKEKADLYVANKIDEANNFLDSLSFDTGFLEYYSKLIFNRKN